MIDPPRITQTAALLTANVHLTVPREEIRTVMGPGLARCGAAIAAQGSRGDGAVVYAPPEDTAGHLRF